MKRAFFLFSALALVLLVSACASKNKGNEKPAEVLAQEGMAAYDKGDYTVAIQAFETLRDWYPFSKFIPLAELKIADSHFAKEEYDEAIVGYEQFEKMHPSNEAVPYVIHQIGMAYFKQRRSPDRDQSPSENALAAFSRLRSQFPDSPYSAQCADEMRECLRLMAEHDLLIGEFYYRQDKYEAALARFEKVVEKYEDTGVHKQALDYIEKTRARMAKN
ncbi:MAG: outer membrane protein assembly factor BamD [Thermodesulfobacteriota bacterium]